MLGKGSVTGATAIAAALVLGISAAAEAQSTTEGFHLAGYLNAAGIQYETVAKTETGPGIGLALGYGASRAMTIYLDVGEATVSYRSNGSYSLAHVDLGAKLHFGGPQRSLLGYAVGALTGRAGRTRLARNVVNTTGAGVTLGGGVLLFLDSSTAIDFGLRWTSGRFSEAEQDGDFRSIDEGAHSARVSVGLSWWAG